MSKAKYCIEMKQAVVKEYLSGEGSYEALAKKHGIGSKSIKDWVRKYREHGKRGLQPDTAIHHTRQPSRRSAWKQFFEGKAA